MRAASGDGNHAGPRAQRGTRRHQDRAGVALVAAGQRHEPRTALVRRARPLRQADRERGFVEQRGGRLDAFVLRHAEIAEHLFAAKLRPGPGVEAKLAADEAHAQIGLDGGPERLPGVGRQAARKIDREHEGLARQSANFFDGLGRESGWRARQTGAVDRIDDDGRLAQAASLVYLRRADRGPIAERLRGLGSGLRLAERPDAHLDAIGLRQASEHVTVAAVVAWPADDIDAPRSGAPPAQFVPGRDRCTAHECIAGDRQPLDRPAIELARLRCRIQWKIAHQRHLA